MTRTMTRKEPDLGIESQRCSIVGDCGRDTGFVRECSQISQESSVAVCRIACDEVVIVNSAAMMKV